MKKIRLICIIGVWVSGCLHAQNPTEPPEPETTYKACLAQLNLLDKGVEQEKQYFQKEVAGKVMQRDGQTPMDADMLDQHFTQFDLSVKEVRKEIDRVYKDTTRGVMAVSVFQAKCHRMVESVLTAAWEARTISLEWEQKRLLQESAAKKRLYAKRLKEGESKATVAEDEEKWHRELETQYDQLAKRFAQWQRELEKEMKTWEESGDVARSVYSTWAEDYLAFDPDEGAMTGSMLEVFIRSKKWNVVPVATDEGLRLGVDKYLKDVAEGEYVRIGVGRPPYPRRLYALQPVVMGTVAVGPVYHAGLMSTEVYWGKEQIELALEPMLWDRDVILAVFGRNLKPHLGDLTIKSGDPKVKYQIVGLAEMTKYKNEYGGVIARVEKLLLLIEEVYQRSFDRKGLEVVLIRATLLDGASSGDHKYQIGDLDLGWRIPKATNEGVVALFRYMPDGVPRSLLDVTGHTVDGFDHDRCTLVVRSQFEVPEGKEVNVRLVRLRNGVAKEIQILGQPILKAKPAKGLNDLGWNSHVRKSLPHVYQTNEIRLKIEANDDPSDDVISCLEGDLILPLLIRPGSLQQRGEYRTRMHANPLDMGAPFVGTLVEVARKRGVSMVIPPSPMEERRKRITELANLPVVEIDKGSFFADGRLEVEKNRQGTSSAQEMIKMQDLAMLEMIRVEMLKQMEPQYKKLSPHFEIIKNNRSYVLKRNNPSEVLVPYNSLDYLYGVIRKNGQQKLLKAFKDNDYLPVEQWFEPPLNYQLGMEPPTRARLALQRMEYHLTLAHKQMKADLEKLKAIDVSDDDDVETLFEMTAPSAMAMMSPLGGRLVRKVTGQNPQDPKDYWWENDSVSGVTLSNLAGKYQTLMAKEFEGDQYDTLQMWLLAGVGVGAGMFTTAEQSFLGVSGELWATIRGLHNGAITIADVLVDIQEYEERGSSEAFTNSLSVLLGAEFVTLRKTSEAGLSKELWQVVLNGIAAGLGVTMDGFAIYKNVDGLKSATSVSAQQQVAVSAAYQAPSELLDVIRVTERMEGSVDSAEGVIRILEVRAGRQMGDGGELVGRIVVRPRDVNPALVQSGDDVVGMHEVANSLAQWPTPFMARIEALMAEGGSAALSADLEAMLAKAAKEMDLPEGAIKGAMPPAVHLPSQGQNWRGYELGGHVGEGAYSRVYLLEDDLVVKVGLLPEGKNAATYVRVMESTKILEDAGIPTLALKPEMSQSFDDTFALVQERLPEGGIVLKRGKRISVVLKDTEGDLAGSTAQRVKGINFRNLLKQQGQTRINPKLLAKLEGRAMPSEYAIAICELYDNIAKKGLIWTDGHLGNVVFVKEGNTWTAKVIDADFVWKWNENFYQSGIRGKTGGGMIGDFYANLGNPLHPMGWTRKMQSMAGSTVTGKAGLRASSGQHLLPDSRTFMMKMLEHHGFIHYDRQLKQWVDGMMSVDDVKQVFGDFDDPKWIDMKFSSLSDTAHYLMAA